MSPETNPGTSPETGPETGPEEKPATPPRQTLAMRLAERERQRALRAERLARLRPAGAGPGAESGAESGAETGPETRLETRLETGPRAALAVAGVEEAAEAEAALADFLRALAGPVSAPAAPVAATVEPGAVLHFQRPERSVDLAAAAAGLGRLPGAGPGLVWALERAGLAALADVAALEPEALAARLGPIGRLVPAHAWIAASRAAVPAGDPVL